jgi:uncharacterized OsmC-like protein
VRADELRALQSPLKEQYRREPETAVVTLRAAARLDETAVSCHVDTGRAMVEAGLHPATGGTGQLACSGDLLLQALVACAGVTLRAVATAMGVTIRSGRVVAEGSWDARGTLGIDKAVPVGLTDIALRFEIDSDADPAKLERMIQTTERYCVILQTLRQPPRITVGSS